MENKEIHSFLPKNKKVNLIHSNIYTIKNQDF